MKNENLNHVLKGLLSDKITLILTMFLGLLTILSSFTTNAQQPIWYNGQEAHGVQYNPGIFWRYIEEYEPNPSGNVPRNHTLRFAGGHKHIKTEDIVSGDKRASKSNNDVESKTADYIRFGLPITFEQFIASMSLGPDAASSNYNIGDRHPGNNPHKSRRNFETPYSSHINSKIPNENSEDTVKKTQENSNNSPFVGDFGFSRPYKNETSREINNPDFRIVNGKGGGGGRRQPTVKVSKRPTSSVLKPLGGDKVVFPDRYRAEKYLPTLSKCTKKKDTLCETFNEGYPSEYISQILKKDGVSFKEFFGKDRADLDISERINVAEEFTLCPSRHEVIFPKAAKNTEDKWLFIINQDKYIQGISVEICIKPNTSCEFTEGFPVGYSPYCKQRYIERRMVALGEDGKAMSDSFWIPSCCVCVLNNSAMLPKT